jgi:hypothetical protein
MHFAHLFIQHYVSTQTAQDQHWRQSSHWWCWIDGITSASVLSVCSGLSWELWSSHTTSHVEPHEFYLMGHLFAPVCQTENYMSIPIGHRFRSIQPTSFISIALVIVFLFLLNRCEFHRGFSLSSRRFSHTYDLFFPWQWGGGCSPESQTGTVFTW